MTTRLETPVPDATLAIDETGFLKQRALSEAILRWHCAVLGIRVLGLTKPTLLSVQHRRRDCESSHGEGLNISQREIGTRGQGSTNEPARNYAPQSECDHVCPAA